MDWQAKLTEWLINAGTVGRRQSELISRVSTKVDDREVLSFLNSLLAEGKVQKFILPGGVIQWRATTKILPPKVEKPKVDKSLN
jgi:hypothetical protein